MTVRQEIDEIEVRLQAAGIEHPRADAEWLLSHALGLSRTSLLLHLGDSLPAEMVSRIDELLIQREQRIPLQQIIGTAAFLSHELRVTPDVLTPRPETEQLALRCIEILRAAENPNPRVLDWGTGSGCLAIAIASAVPGSQVTAIDVSTAALALARENALAQNAGAPIGFVLGDGFAALSGSTALFDLIVSNPPYIPRKEIAELQPEIRDHEPSLALDGGEDGLDVYRRLAAEAQRWIAPHGSMALEFGDGQAPALEFLFSANNWVVKSVEKDLSARERILIVHPPRSDGLPS